MGKLLCYFGYHLRFVVIAFSLWKYAGWYRIFVSDFYINIYMLKLKKDPNL